MGNRQVWVSTDQAATAMRERLASLVGRRLLGGSYFDLGLGSAGPIGPGPFHALDFGLQLEVTEGSAWSFIWKMDGEIEGLLAYEGPLIGVELEADGDYRSTDLRNLPEWSPFIGARIASAQIAWDAYGSGRRVPVTFVLGFDEQQQVVLTLGTAAVDGRFRGSADDVAVFFSVEDAKKHGVDLPE